MSWQTLGRFTGSTPSASLNHYFEHTSPNDLAIEAGMSLEFEFLSSRCKIRQAKRDTSSTAQLTGDLCSAAMKHQDSGFGRGQDGGAAAEYAKDFRTLPSRLFSIPYAEARRTGRTAEKGTFEPPIDAVSLYPTYRKPFDMIYRRAKTHEWSGREDLNLRPPGPEPGALPG